MLIRHRVLKSAPVAVMAMSIAAALSGCGGTTTSSKTLRSTLPSSIAAYGVEAGAYVNGVGSFETSGLSDSDGAPVATGATASDAVPIAAQSGATGTIPLGFAPGAFFIDGATSGKAIAPSATGIQFHVALSNGVDTSTDEVLPVTGATLTSSEVESFSQTFSFVPPPYSGPLANATYVTPTFTLPFTTTGLHSLTVHATDTRETKTTTYDVVVVGPSDAAALVEILDPDGNPMPGATATITQPSGVRSQTTADEQGVVVLFSKPGPQTITATSGSTSGTLNVKLTAGQLTTIETDDNQGNALTLPLSDTSGS